MNFNKVSHLLLSTTFISFELVASQKHHNIHLIVYGEWNETCHLLYIHTSAMLCNSSVKMICDYIFFLFILLSNWDVQLWLAHFAQMLLLFATFCHGLHRLDPLLPFVTRGSLQEIMCLLRGDDLKEVALNLVFFGWERHRKGVKRMGLESHFWQ